MIGKHERAIEAAFNALEERICAPLALADAYAAIAAYIAVMREPGPGEVRVRACVAVCEDPERWGVAGWNGEDADLRDASIEGLDEYAVQHHFINANVPAWRPPAEHEIEGECEA
jgi:hypothetical protein